jgi:carboxyl-terminal processing protease
MGQKLKIAGWISLGVVAGALSTVSLQTVARGTLAPMPLEELQQLSTVFGLIKSDYVEPVDEKKLINDAISGMVASLDPHSQYFDKKSYKEFREGTTGKFVGVGIEISQEDGLVKVVSPIEGSPADRAGLKPGDLITTGTPPGVGMGMKPSPVYLKPGDVMELGIEKLGQQRQTVYAWDPVRIDA